MNHKEFEKLVAEGIDAIDPIFLAKLKNVEIVIEDDPSPEQMQKLKIHSGFLFGLYEGVPQTKREQYGQVLPDKITIFKNQIERFFSHPEGIREAVTDTVWHEVAHHFGMDEKQVRQAEQKRRSAD